MLVSDGFAKAPGAHRRNKRQESLPGRLEDVEVDIDR